MSRIIFTGTHGKMDGVYIASNRTKDAKIALLVQSPNYDPKVNILEKRMLQQVFNLLTYLGYDTLWIKLHDDTPYDSINNLLYTADSLDWLQGKVSMAGDCLVVANVYATWTLMQLVMRRPEIQRFILLSPSFWFENFNFMHPCPIPGLVVHGGKSDIVKVSALEQVIQEIRNMTSCEIDLQILNDADQTFQNFTEPLLRLLYRYLINESRI